MRERGVGGDGLEEGQAFQPGAPKQEGTAFLGPLWSPLRAGPGVRWKLDACSWQGGWPGVRNPLEDPSIPKEQPVSSLPCAKCETSRAVPAGLVSSAPPPPVQIEMLSPYEAVCESFKEQYKTFATALDTTRHELPVRSVHLDGGAHKFLGRTGHLLGKDQEEPPVGIGTSCVLAPLFLHVILTRLM